MLNVFTPTICKDKHHEEDDGKIAVVPAAYQGSVTMRMPDFTERLDLYEGLDDDEEVVGDPAEEGISPEERKARKQIDERRNRKRLVTLCRRAPAFVTEVNITRVKDGFVFKTWDAVSKDTVLGSSVVPEVAGELIKTFEVGKDSPAG